MQGNVFLNESLKNLSEDLNIYDEEMADLIMQKTKGAVGNLMASAYEQAAITRAESVYKLCRLFICFKLLIIASGGMQL